MGASGHEVDVVLKEPPGRRTVVAKREMRERGSAHPPGQRSGDRATVADLPYPRHRNVAHRAGGDQPVVLGVLVIARETITGHEHGRVLGRGERVTGPVGHGRVVLDRGHGPVAEPMTHQRSRVAGAGADLQHLVSVGDLSGLQHQHHQAGQRRRGRGHSRNGAARTIDRVPVDLRHPGLVPVRQLQPLVFGDLIAVDHLPPIAVLGGPGDRRAEKSFPRHRLDRIPPAWAAKGSGLGELVGEGTAEPYGFMNSHVGSSKSRSAMAAAMGNPVASSSQAHCPLGLHSRNTGTPSPVSAKSNAPKRRPSAPT